jgi:hypothetical protein
MVPETVNCDQCDRVVLVLSYRVSINETPREGCNGRWVAVTVDCPSCGTRLQMVSVAGEPFSE